MRYFAEWQIQFSLQITKQEGCHFDYEKTISFYSAKSQSSQAKELRGLRAEVPEEDMPLLTESSERTALVLYGSETGRAQDVADELGNITERLHFITRVAEMDSIEPVRSKKINLRVQHTYCAYTCFLKDRLARNAINLVVVSTTGQGDLPENTQRFWKKLLRRRLGASFLQNVRFTVFGLGDSSYPKYGTSCSSVCKEFIDK